MGRVNPSTAAARVLVDELVRCGVAEAVLCPGSRSAPLAYALAAADADPAVPLRLHVRTDERAAGFLALGLAAASGRVVPVVTTSGTAVANLHPAVLEAHHGRIINTHPALLPSFPGAHGVRDALAHGVKITGATVHRVVPEVDAGQILAQTAVAVAPEDDEDSLHERIKAAERELLVDTVAQLSRG